MDRDAERGSRISGRAGRGSEGVSGGGARRAVTRLFFFKQKTAYEMRTRLEFRRVLFRSGGTYREVVERGTLPDPPPGSGPAQVLARRGIGRASCRERCRSRWSPYH